LYALVAIARPVTGPFSYAIPAALAGQVGVGHVVLAPFGQRGAETGYVVGLAEDPGVDPAKVKPIQRLLDPTPAFDGSQLEFFRWIADYYLAPLGLVIHTALPSRMAARVLEVLDPTDEGVEALASAAVEGALLPVLREVIARPGLTRRGLARRLHDLVEPEDVSRAVDGLLRRGFVAWAEREAGAGRATVTTVRLAMERAAAAAAVPRLGTRMAAILDALERAGGPVDLTALAAEQGATVHSAVRRLAEVGAVVVEAREWRDALAEAAPMGPREPPPLNEDQRAALSALTAADAAGAFLLFGVTGSGKTEVFLGAAAHALAAGRQVLVLVPEIGLTPQLVGRFAARFGDEVAVLHSGLTGAERLAQWRRIRAGEARVAVGARSALFAPFSRLGLVVVDEEHDDSYKQDEGVRYSARDLAVVLGARHGCPVVLASATPSLETWHNAEQGKYRLLRLPRRATAQAVPTVEIVDMTAVDVDEQGRRPMFHPDVVRALGQTFAAGGKAIVLYNRRGYASMVRCDGCGGTYDCPNCRITLTLHRSARNLACHYCGFKRPLEPRCPACGADALVEVGKGTEKVEETLAALFPAVPQLRMDADTTAVRGAHHEILAAFREGGARLLVGTQIVAKGHDIPDVHTAVVVSADSGFRMPDFRSAERTYALLVQVAGRAGRGETAGRVLVQTWDADHYALAHLDDVTAFFDVELRLRRTLRYPPYTRLALVRLEGARREAVADAARALARALRDEARRASGVDVLGPAAAALPVLVGRWRFQVVLRGAQPGPFRRFLAAWRERLDAASRGGVRVSVDVDPRHLM
jgi:primosomal protein N' (replication factor Y)